MFVCFISLRREVNWGREIKINVRRKIMVSRRTMKKVSLIGWLIKDLLQARERKKGMPGMKCSWGSYKKAFRPERTITHVSLNVYVYV